MSFCQKHKPGNTLFRSPDHPIRGCIINSTTYFPMVEERRDEEQSSIDPAEVGKVWEFVTFPATTTKTDSKTPSSTMEQDSTLRQRRGHDVSPPTGAESHPSSSQEASSSRGSVLRPPGNTPAGAPPHQPISTLRPPPTAYPAVHKSFRQRFLSFQPLPWWSLLIFMCFFFSELRWRINESPCGILGLPDPVNASQIKRAFRTISL